MQKEYIMSEEDKEMKRKKIEANRIKRKIEKVSSDSDTSSSESKKILKVEENLESPEIHQNQETIPSFEISPAEIVEKITSASDNSGNVISAIFKNQEESLKTVTKILTDPDSALKLISHFIEHPNIAMLILSKIMNSPFDTLTVFSQFMRSPTDALQIISKIMSNPNEVLTFLQQLMKFPQDALEIMNKFLNCPSEALQILNKMMNHSSLINLLPLSHKSDDSELNSDEMMKSILSVNSTNSAQSVREDDDENYHSFSCQDEKKFDPNSMDSNNNPESRRSIAELANEVMDDVKMASSSQAGTVNALDSIISEAISLEFGIRPISSHISKPGRELNEIEQAKLNELIVSNKALYAPVDDDLSNLILEDYKMKSSNDPGTPPDPRLLNV
jgi:nuclear receptor subfamily 1 group I